MSEGVARTTNEDDMGGCNAISRVNLSRIVGNNLANTSSKQTTTRNETLVRTGVTAKLDKWTARAQLVTHRGYGRLVVFSGRPFEMAASTFSSINISGRFEFLLLQSSRRAQRGRAATVLEYTSFRTNAWLGSDGTVAYRAMDYGHISVLEWMQERETFFKDLVPCLIDGDMPG